MKGRIVGPRLIAEFQIGQIGRLVLANAVERLHAGVLSYNQHNAGDKSVPSWTKSQIVTTRFLAWCRIGQLGRIAQTIAVERELGLGLFYNQHNVMAKYALFWRKLKFVATQCTVKSPSGWVGHLVRLSVTEQEIGSD